MYREGNLVGFWNAYVDNLMTEEQIAAFDAHRCGTMELHPFYEQLMNDMAIAYYKNITGMNSTKLSTFGVYNSLKAPQSKYMFDNDPETYYHSGQGQRTDDYVAVDMSGVSEVREVKIVQGRNSVDDVDYFDHAIVEYSVDGEEWLPLTEELTGVYEISWKGSVEARYIRLRKLESQKRNWLAIRSFEVNPVEKSEFGWDGNPFTAVQIAGALSFEMPKGGKMAYLMLGKLPKEGVVCRLLNKDGEEISKHKVTSSFHAVALTSDVYALDVRGKVELFEALIYTDDSNLPVKM
jgi:hyaluronoglucosaminidase